MVNLSPEIAARFAEVRKDKGMSQTSLAALVGCKQSAVSMFEAGMTGKISEETVRKIARVLEIDLDVEKGKKVENALTVPAGMVRGFCPDCRCVSNVPYTAGGRLFFRPSLNLASPSGGDRCALCGEVLEKKCPACGAELNDGACCGRCGSAYVVPVLAEGTDAESWAVRRREEIALIRGLF